MKILIFGVMFLLFAGSVVAQDVDYSVFDSKGNEAGLDDIVDGMSGAQVLFLGELHDDSVGHRLQFELFKKVVEKYRTSHSVSLSLEMFERDVQGIVNEYLDGLITEKLFLAASRPWGNYKTDYRPLVELAKKEKLPVIAANAPRRYVNMVSRLGRDSLRKLPLSAKQWLAPLPYGQASDAYVAKFNALMKSMSDDTSPAAHNPMVHSQALWDATMAYSISEHLWQNENALIVHLNGGFHTEKRLGTPEHLVHYKKGTKFLVVTMRYEKDFTKFDAVKHKDLGDFVILTDASAPRSKR